MRRRGAALLALFTAATFGSAFLLFLIQPMFGRFVLPLLGGSPAVWNTCMLFFQAALLGGYLYAHLSTRLSIRRQAALHLLLLAGAALLLPISVRGAAPEGGAAPIPWLLRLMLVTVGPPFLILAGTGPILQRWFSRSGHPDAGDPYRLYAASNGGSMLALLVYPALVEPRLRLTEQSAGWGIGYALLVLGVAGCIASVWRPTPALAGDSAGEAARLPVPERMLWIILAFIPSSLLLGVTTYLTTDLTAAPLLWVLPLALYLLSFTLVFAPRVLLPHRWMLAVQPAILAGVALLLLGRSVDEPALVVPVHLAALFVTAMVCHGELARRRPPVRHLTEFYLWIAVGGVLGGAFNALAAPVLFSRTWEYPLVLVLACLARPWPERSAGLRAHLRPALRTAAFVFAFLLLTRESVAALPDVLHVLLAAATAVLFARALGRFPPGLTLCLGALLLVRTLDNLRDEHTLFAHRSFFGSYRVTRVDVGPGYHALVHGSTLHGAQALSTELRREPLTYYLRAGPLGDVFRSMGLGTRPWRVAVVGLGSGTTAAYGSEGERWTFYEIDPGIERIARDPRLFSYLRDSPADVRVVLGDARLSLVRAPLAAYDLILLDAFTSDAIPVHLLTREALGLYLSRLAPGGRIAFHVSNRYLDLEAAIAALARERGLAALVSTGPATTRRRYEQPSTWLVVAREPGDLAALATDRRWRAPELRAGLRPWTDDHSSLLSVFRW